MGTQLQWLYNLVYKTPLPAVLVKKAPLKFTQLYNKERAILHIKHELSTDNESSSEMSHTFIVKHKYGSFDI